MDGRILVAFLSSLGALPLLVHVKFTLLIKFQLYCAKRTKCIVTSDGGVV